MDDLISRQAAIDEIEAKFDEIYKTKQAGATFPHDDFFQGMAYAADIVKNIPSAQPEIIRCNSCKYWTQSTGKMKGYGLGRCDFHDADLVTCNGFCYWAERRNDG